MALTPLLGSLTPSSDRSTLPNDIPNTQSDVLPHMPFVRDTHLNKYAIDTTQYADVTKQLLGVIKGKRVTVTYYRLLNREGNDHRNNVADFSTARNIIDTEYQKILNLEITLQKEFDFSVNTQQTSMSIKGQAMFYPNMNPNVGDMFLMGMGDGRVGVARISQVNPMSWRSDRVYLVDFVIPEFVDPSQHDPIEGSVTITSVFSKENYLGGTAALLSEQTYVQLLKIKQARRQLCQFFHNTFFDPNLSSYIRPDGVYDPWVVKFIAGKISGDDLHIRPKNLLGDLTRIYEQTIWARLDDRYNSTLYGIAPFCNVQKYRQSNMGVFVTELFGKSCLHPSFDSAQGEYYIFSENFYKGVTASMNDWEELIYAIVTKRAIGDLSIFITNYLDLIFTKTPTEQFTLIPLLIHACDVASQSQYREVDAPSMNYASNNDQTL